MRRRAPLNLFIAAAVLVTAAVVTAPSAPASAAHRDAGGAPSVEVFAADDGTVPDGGDLRVSVVISNPSTEDVSSGHVAVSVTTAAISTPSALSDFQQNPGQFASRRLGNAATSTVPAGGTLLVAQLTVPAANVHLPSTTPGVFGLSASVTTGDGALSTGAGTLVVPGATPATVGVAAVMPITAPADTTGLVSSQDLATYTGPDGVLTRELSVAQSNPGVTIAIDPMLLVSVRVLGQHAPASAQEWLATLSDLPNPSFALQYGDADPGLQTQAGVAAPLQPSDFSYALGDFSGSLTVGEPTTEAPTPTASPTNGPQLPTLDQLVGFPYTLNGIAWPAAGTVGASDLAAFTSAGLTTTIVSSSNTNAAKLNATPAATLSTDSGKALVIDDAVSGALQAAAGASDSTTASVAMAQLNAQLALAAQHAPTGTVVLASLGRTWPTDDTRAATALMTALSSTFTRGASLQAALAQKPTAGLTLVDHKNSDDRVQRARALLDLAGEPRVGGSPDTVNIATFSTALSNPALLTGDVRARLLQLFSVGWAGSSDWAAAVSKQLSAMHSDVTAVQISAPGSIRQASRQALIPITVTNKLAHPVDVVLRATPRSPRLEVDADTVKTVAAGSSAKVLIPVKSQLSNGTVHLDMQLYSKTGVEIGASRTAEIDVHADWEGIGAVIFGVVVVGFFGFGVLRTIQRRRRERGEADAGDSDEDTTDAGSDDSSSGSQRG